jgi:outer membrane protein OmpA-like peptidoglycan-associated protein
VRADSFVLHFSFDHSQIRSTDSSALGRFIHRQLYPAGDTAVPHDIDSIAVTGYTDTVGTPEYNLRLSVRRAMVVAEVFRQSLGPDSSLITHIDGRGEDEPLPGDDSESRRVIIVCWHHPPPPPPPVIVQRDTPRSPDEPDTILRLDDIRFYANTTNLTQTAQTLLPRHINYLMTLKDRYLEIDGYCNSPGALLKPNDPLYILSVKRAKFIYDQLIERGFDSTRLLYKGKGNANPRNAHPVTRDEMDTNMRVEIQVFKTKPQP